MTKFLQLGLLIETWAIIAGKCLRTSVDAWELPPEVDERRHLVDAVLLGVAVVVDLHERDVQGIGLAVDLLQVLQHLLAVGAVIRVCKSLSLQGTAFICSLF